MIRAGRRPCCSRPTMGSGAAQTTSPRLRGHSPSLIRESGTDGIPCPNFIPVVVVGAQVSERRAHGCPALLSIQFIQRFCDESSSSNTACPGASTDALAKVDWDFDSRQCHDCITMLV